MMNKKIGMIIISFVVSLLFVQPIRSGTTGKIAGRVVDKSTGEPMPGANIIIVGTTLGAAADADGNFTIINLTPGTYDLRASVIGYAPISINNVRVRIDQSTRVDFALEMEVIQGQTVTIVAERKPVQADVATSVAVLSGTEVKELPLANIMELVELQAGVESGLEIRGGGADEALFQIDGITLRDPRNNKPITGIALSAVQEISIERGGFNAEYGQVRSGIVNVVTREGSKTGYHGSFTTKYSPPAAKYFGMSPYDPNSIYLRPYLDDAVCWTGTQNGTWDYYTQKQYPTFDGWNAISERLMTDDDPGNNLSPAAAQRLFKWQHRQKEVNDQPDYIIDAGFGGPVPVINQYLGNLRFFTSYRRQREIYIVPLTRDDYLDYDWTVQLTSDLSQAMKLKISGLYGKSYNIAMNGTEQEYSTHYIRTPYEVVAPLNQSSQIPERIFGTGYYSLAEVRHHSWAAKLTHTLSASSYYDASIEHVARHYHTEPTAARDETPRYEIIDGYFVNEAPYGFSPEPENGIGDGMFFGGHTSTTRDYSKISATTVKFDLTSQANFHNLVKTGVELVYNDLDLDYGVVNKVFPESNQWTKRQHKPLRAALYLQNKLEVEGLIVNAGLRLDYSNSNTDWVAHSSFFKPFFSANYDATADYDLKNATSQWSLSPRLGISHPITENSKLFFNYGHFKQLPTYEQLFRLSRGTLNQVSYIGNPNLTLAKTISYELGYDQSLLDTYLIQLAAFYHDIKDQLAFTNFISADGSMNYYAANSNSYEDIRGFELTLRKSTGRWFSGFANYTYQVSTSGFFGTDLLYQSVSEQRDYERETRNRYQFRPIPEPYARASLLFSAPPDFGPQILNIHLLGDWKMNLIGDWRSGGWVTWKTIDDKSVTQNVQIKDFYNFKMRLTKTFSLKKLEVAFILDVDNLLNTKRLSLVSFYDAIDYQDYMGSLHLPASRVYNNIAGNDRIGDYRKDEVPFQPIEAKGNVYEVTNPSPEVIYYDHATQKYMNYVNGNWAEVAKNRMKKVLDDKAYIDMPNQTSFNFLNPRKIFIGIRVSFNLD